MKMPPEIKAILDARYRASIISENLTGAYWSEFNRGHLVRDSEEQLRKLAAAFGFDLIERAASQEPANIIPQSAE